MGNREDIGVRIKTYRKSRGMTQLQLATMLGCAPSTIGMYETGQREPDLDQIEHLVSIFGIPISALVVDANASAPGGMPMEQITTTAKRLKQVMEMKGLKQVDVIHLAQPYCQQYNLQLTKSDLSQFLSGKVKPRRWKISLLSHALNVSEAWLLGYDVPMERITDHANPPNEYVTPEELTLLTQYRSLTPQGRDFLQAQLIIARDHFHN